MNRTEQKNYLKTSLVEYDHYNTKVVLRTQSKHINFKESHLSSKLSLIVTRLTSYIRKLSQHQILEKFVSLPHFEVVDTPVSLF